MTMKTALDNEMARTELLSRFSHEIRTPLTSIIGYAEVMLSDPKLPNEAKREYVEIIRNAGKRLSEFLDMYIETEFVERNSQLDPAHHGDVSFLLQSAAERIAPQALEKSVSVVCTCDPAMLIKGVSADQVSLILENLLVNAIAFAHEGGHIDVKAVQNASVTKIEVINKDRGFLSLSANSAGKEFRWIQSPGIEIRHDGLGLAFAKHVVELEGGSLNVQGFDQGLTFTLQFPRPGHN